MRISGFTKEQVVGLLREAERSGSVVYKTSVSRA